MKVLKCIGFFILAALVFVGFVYPFITVPDRFEAKARELAEARVESAVSPVDQHYIDESVNDAMQGDINNILRTAAIIAAAIAAVIFCASIRPPHDCGGLNLFNPLYLIPVAAISVLTSVCVCLAFAANPGPEVNGFYEFIARLSGAFSDQKLILMLLVPAALELIFRGIIFSYLEKIHFSVAIVLSTLCYAAAAYFMVASHTKWSLGSELPAKAAFFAALGIGGVHAIITWRLRSVIPAVLSHMLMALSASRVAAFCGNGSFPLPAAIAGLVILLAALVLLPALFGKKRSVLAYDFPFTKLHEKRDEWLFGSKKKKEKSKGKKADGSPAAEPVNNDESNKEENEKPIEAKAEEAAEKVGEKTEEVAEKVVEKAEEAAEKVVEKAEEAAGKVEEKAEEAAGKVEEKAEEAAEKVVEAAEKVEEKAEEAAGIVEEKAEEAAEKVVEKAEEAAGTVEEKAEEAAGIAAGTEA